MEKIGYRIEHSYLTTSKSYRAFLAYILRQRKRHDSTDCVAPGILATLYLDCFLLHKEKLCAPTVIRLGLCGEGKFTEWRKEQKRLGNLDWDSVSFGDFNQPINYTPSPKIQRYIGKVADEHGLHASKGYVDHKIDEVRSEINERLMKLEKAVQRIVDVKDPPGDSTKYEKYVEDEAYAASLLN